MVEADLVLYSGGRDANSEKIGCENVGVEVGKYGRIRVDPDFRTANPRIFAIGDVIGPPGEALGLGVVGGSGTEGIASGPTCGVPRSGGSLSPSPKGDLVF